MGVWLPLALADITAMLFKLVAMWAKNGDEVKIPKRSEQLAAWALPFTASALKADEEEQERREKAEKVKVLQAQLAAMQEKYGRSKNADQVHK
ncbi:MAG: hypothetical protein II265_07630 [Clostridia bacterium]|nr:hypothetical protein [Clostridia bacterium]